MENKELGWTDSVKGNLDSIPDNLSYLKDSVFSLKLMSTYGGLIPFPNQKAPKGFFKESNGRYSAKSFTYTEAFANHYLYQHAVDDHNNLRHLQPYIESTLIIRRWFICLFSFILAISEVNTFLAFRYFIWKEEPDKMTLYQFCQKLILSLINNEYLHTDEDGTKLLRKKSQRKLDQLQSTDHVRLSAPPHSKKIYFGKWQLMSKAKYRTNNLLVNMLGAQTK